VIAMSGAGRFQGAADYLKLAGECRGESSLAKPLGRDELRDAVRGMMRAA
jgi:hypothetical protein